jgi:protein ImuB
MPFAEPLLTAEAFTTVIGRLTRLVCAGLERTGQGARQVDLLFERVDGSVQTVRVGTARPTRDPVHLARLLDEQVETVDPGLGVEAMHLVVPLAEALGYAQTAHLAAAPEADIADLVDRLSNRLGAARVWRAAPVESDVPERSVRQVAALTPPGGRDWPGWPRPARLLNPPQPVDALALLPDQPPAAFTWRRRRHRVRRADGPERIAGEWWRRDAEAAALRDYWQVEDEAGRRYWLYRRGDGVDAATGDLRWFVHGVF